MAFELDTEDAALIVLRAAVGVRRGVMRRREERVMLDELWCS